MTALGGDALNFAELCCLVEERFPQYGGLAPDGRPRVLRLNRWYVRNVLFRPRDKWGNLRVVPKGRKQASGRELFYAHYQFFGVPAWHIDELWHRRQAKPAPRKGRVSDGGPRRQSDRPARRRG